MTITKHTPVVPGETALARLEWNLESGAIDLERPLPPRWLDKWLDLDTYRAADTATRRELVAEALEREHQHKTAEEALSSAESAGIAPTARASAYRLPDVYARAQAGTPYVACSGNCGSLLRRARPAVTYCPACENRLRKARAHNLTESENR